MMELKRVGVVSYGKISALFGVVFGFIIGLFFSLAFATVMLNPMMGGLVSTGYTNPLAITALMGTWAIIILPIAFGIGGFIGGAIKALIYNFLAGRFGGIEVDLQQPKAAK